MPVIDGEQHYSSQGILEVVKHYDEDGTAKVQVFIHQVEPEDGVTPTGHAVLMSTTPDTIDSWISRFPRDMAERRAAVGGMKDRFPALRPKLEAILSRIDAVKGKRPDVPERGPKQRRRNF